MGILAVTANEIDEEAASSGPNAIEEWLEARELEVEDIANVTTHVMEEFLESIEAGNPPSKAVRIVTLMSLHIGFEAAMRHRMPNPLAES